MNTKNENEEPAEKVDTRPLAPGLEPLEPEPNAAAAKEAAEFRETAERGYGWGV